MSQAVLDRLRADRDSARDAAIAMASADDFDPTAEAYNALETRAASLDGQVQRLAALLEAQSAADSLDARLGRVQRRSEPAPQTTDSPGEVFTRSEAYTRYQFQGSSARVELPLLQTRAALTSGGAGGLGPQATRIDITQPAKATPLLDLIRRIPVSTNAVEYVKWTFTSAADVVAEKAVKPESTLTRTVTSAAIPTVAHFVEATRQLLEDSSAVRAMIEDELRRGVLVKFNALVAAALVGATLPTATGDTLLASIRNGIAAVPDGYVANAVLLNPTDWAELDIEVLGATVNGPVRTQTFWGLTPVSSALQPAGTATVGDFTEGVTNFYRSGVDVFITDSHGSNFTANIFTLLGEGRSLVDVTQPQALVECTVTTP